MPTQDFSNLPYRKCVGIALFNQDRNVWIGRRIPKANDGLGIQVWQMPQGGIDDGETPEEAARRELFEETGVSSASILSESRDWLSYDLPDAILGKALKGRYRGQVQKWFAMRFEGPESEINISAKPGHKAEFEDWKWAPLISVPELIVPFKRDVYWQVVDEFKEIRI